MFVVLASRRGLVVGIVIFNSLFYDLYYKHWR